MYFGSKENVSSCSIESMELRKELTEQLVCSEIVGVTGDEDPPVPIPNTEVKLISVENTWRVTAWEDRAMPTF